MRSIALVSLCALAACGGDASGGVDAGPASGEQVEILRDAYGIPHVYADSLRGAAFAWGYAHAEDMRALVLGPLYAGEAGSAPVFGHDCGSYDCAALDGLARLFRVPELVDAEYAALDGQTRRVLEAYADGVNHFFQSLDSPPAGYAEPVTPQMVAGGMQLNRIVRALVQAQIDTGALTSSLTRAPEGEPASNQFAATGDRTAAQTTVLGSDPHSPWGLFGRQGHIHLQFQDYDVFGATGLFAGPQIECGGNNFVQFGCTSLSSAATAVSVTAELSPDETAYFDHRAGDFVPFETRTIRIEVAGDDDIEEEVLDTRFGPVVGADAGDAIAVHVFSADDLSGIDYLIGAWLSRSADDYAELWDRPTPAETGQNRAFAGREHRVGYVYGAYLPVLDEGLDWSAPVSSGDPSIEWEPERWYNLDGAGPELPHVLDPEGDFAQNCNGHPGWSTEPIGQIPTDLPRYLHDGDGPTSRGRRIRQLLEEASGLDAGGAQAIITDVRSLQAEDLVEALRRGLDAEGIDDPAAEFGADAGALISLLLSWEEENGYRFTRDAEAATVLFHAARLSDAPGFPAPGSTLAREELDALAALLGEVADYMRATYDSFSDPLRVPWGYVNRVRVGDVEVGLPGAPPGLTPIVSAAPLREDGRTDPDPDVRFGSWLTRAVVFGPEGMTPYIAVPQGQIAARAFPDSPHLGQTLEDFADLNMRRVPLERGEVEANPCPFAGEAGHEHPARTVLELPDQA